MRALSTATLLFLFLVPAHSQEKDADFIFSRNHLSVSIVGGLAERSSIKNFQPNNYNTRSREQVAFGGGFNHHTNFSKDLSLIFGVHFICTVKNFEYYIHKEEFTPDYEDDVFQNKNISRQAVFLLRIPASIQKRWWNKPNRYWSATAGVSLMYTFLNEDEETHYVSYTMNGPNIPFFNIFLIPNNDRKPWLNYNFGFGRGIVLKNYNLVTASLMANLSFTNFEKGDYKFFIPGQSTYAGHFAFKGSYVGIECNYVLTHARKRIKNLR